MSLIEAIIRTVAPHTCLVCGEEGGLICAWCAVEAFGHIPPRCYNCYSVTQNSAVCTKCRRLSPLKHVWIRTEYMGTAKDLVHMYKFKQARAGAELLSQYMLEALPYVEGAVLVPVPTASARIRQRGFDHTKVLTKQLSRQSGLPYIAALRRLGQSHQVGTRRNERKSQLKGAFRAVDSLKGQQVTLVDDVVTTGATLEEAARACKQAGAKTVDAIVFAQKQ